MAHVKRTPTYTLEEMRKAIFTRPVMVRPQPAINTGHTKYCPCCHRFCYNQPID